MITRPWETIGKDVSATGSLIEAMREADILFNVSVRQGYFVKAETERGVKVFMESKGHFYVIRDDIDAVLGACKSRFQPLQNSDAFDFFQPLIESNIVKIDTIGTFGLGQKVWLLAEITDAKFQVVHGDSVSLYIILVNAHDGSTSVMAGIVPIRVWCSNMFSMLNRSDFQVIKFKHTGDPAEKLREVQVLINEQLGMFEGFVEQLKQLTKVWPSAVELDAYYRFLFKVKKDASTKAENKVKRLKELFIHGRGNDHTEIRGTWYAAYNAASEFLNYEAGRTPETRLTSLWFGVNNNINHLALQTALSMAKGEPCALRKLLQKV